MNISPAELHAVWNRNNEVVAKHLNTLSHHWGLWTTLSRATKDDDGIVTLYWTSGATRRAMKDTMPTTHVVRGSRLSPPIPRRLSRLLDASQKHIVNSVIAM